MNAKELAHVMLDIFATHELVRNVKPDEHTLRMSAGATLGGLGYIYGPNIEQKLRSGPVDLGQIEFARSDLVYTAAGAALGAMTGHLAGPDVASVAQQLNLHTPNDPEHPEIRYKGLRTLVAAGWLGYSLLVAEHDDEFSERQRWGTGLGALGYLAGPTVINSVKDVVIDDERTNDAITIYRNGLTKVGAGVGAVLGYWHSRKTE